MLPFALLWFGFDFFFISTMFKTNAFSDSGMGSGFGGVILIFFAFHLMPVWIYLGGVLFSIRKYRNTAYIITDRGIYVSGGTFTYNYEMKPFTDLSHINVHRGIFDQMLGVGDVISACEHDGYNSRNSHSHSSGHSGITISDIYDYQKVFQLIRDLQTDIYADTMYPNDLRPGENHGYNTKYRGF